MEKPVGLSDENYVSLELQDSLTRLLSNTDKPTPDQIAANIETKLREIIPFHELHYEAAPADDNKVIVTISGPEIVMGIIKRIAED